MKIEFKNPMVSISKPDFDKAIQEAKADAYAEVFKDIDQFMATIRAVNFIDAPLTNYQKIIDNLAAIKQKYLLNQATKECPDCRHFLGCEQACGGRVCDTFEAQDADRIKTADTSVSVEESKIDEQQKSVTIDVKDKLIELLENADRIAVDQGIADYDKATAFKADYLLAHGVAVTLVKAGQTVYHFCDAFGAVLPYEVQNIHIGFLGKEKAYWSFEATCHSNEDDKLLDDLEFDHDDIGKTVFFSQEEAEKAHEEETDNDR